MFSQKEGQFNCRVKYNAELKQAKQDSVLYKEEDRCERSFNLCGSMLFRIPKKKDQYTLIRKWLDQAY